MYQAHEAVESPPLEAKLWRYMSFTKLISLLEKQALFFARLEELGDPFEGSITAVTAQQKEAVFREVAGDEIVPQVREQIKEVRRYRQSRILVNCWHESENESTLMWRTYANKGVAVVTTAERLINSLVGVETVYIGRVRYMNYDREWMDEKFIHTPALHKRRSFAHEQEVRALMVLQKGGLANTRRGLYYPIDVESLLQQVVISPLMPEWEAELVESLLVRYEIPSPVVQSQLATSPEHWGL